MKSFVDKIREAVVESNLKEDFDPSTLGDEIAEKTEWSPLAPGGSNFKTSKLVFDDIGTSARFKASVGALLFSLVFMAFGVGALIGGVFSFLEKGTEPASFILTGFGTVFTLVGLAMLRFFTTPHVFDKDQGFYWKGRISKDRLAYAAETLKNTVSLKRIHALQIVSEYCSGDKSSYYSYELNLVLDDASRINVVDHGDVKSLRQEAASLAEFLKVPLWDAS